MSPGSAASNTTDQSWLLATLESQQRLIHKVCWAYTRTPEDRDDLFQDIAVRLLSAGRNYDPTRKLSTWVYRVALNVAIDFHRRRQRRRDASIALDAQRQVAAPKDDEQLQELRELDEQLQELRELDEQLQELRELMEQQTEIDRALLLLYLDGNSYREIGDVLGISESNVGTRLNRLKNKLRQTKAVNAG